MAQPAIMKPHGGTGSRFPSPVGRWWRDAPGEGMLRFHWCSIPPHPNPLPMAEGAILPGAFIPFAARFADDR
jgi:hypothetical protein